ncbi:37S ribosomal protein MRP17 [Striga asiatica]|uniref:37S ribosomal protein MRP17 n=1 Tax=Striga asiatica TaxID=4170 RepID=A0A5A7PYP2_STRAF|nr:37S ribosomal protein MRP17 [Striga asiatica]
MKDRSSDQLYRRKRIGVVNTIRTVFRSCKYHTHTVRDIIPIMAELPFITKVCDEMVRFGSISIHKSFARKLRQQKYPREVREQIQQKNPSKQMNRRSMMQGKLGSKYKGQRQELQKVFPIPYQPIHRLCNGTKGRQVASRKEASRGEEDDGS